MNLEHLSQLVARIDYVESTGSTNADVAAAALTSPTDWPDLSVLAAGSQTAGRGRSGRQWDSPVDSSLSVSILVRPHGVGLERFGWLPILAGLAMTKAVAELLPDGVALAALPSDAPPLAAMTESAGASRPAPTG